jgi:hypothetical protein
LLRAIWQGMDPLINPLTHSVAQTKQQIPDIIPTLKTPNWVWVEIWSVVPALSTCVIPHYMSQIHTEIVLPDKSPLRLVLATESDAEQMSSFATSLLAQEVRRERWFVFLGYPPSPALAKVIANLGHSAQVLLISNQPSHTPLDATETDAQRWLSVRLGENIRLPKSNGLVSTAHLVRVGELTGTDCIFANSAGAYIAACKGGGLVYPKEFGGMSVLHDDAWLCDAGLHIQRCSLCGGLKLAEFSELGKVIVPTVLRVISHPKDRDALRLLPAVVNGDAEAIMEIASLSQGWAASVNEQQRVLEEGLN